MRTRKEADRDGVLHTYDLDNDHGFPLCGTSKVTDPGWKWDRECQQGCGEAQSRAERAERLFGKEWWL